jgi:hypothetical protein
VTNEDAYKLADWAVRSVLPAVLSYDDGIRMSFKPQADRIRELRPIKIELDARATILLLREITVEICQYRDGMITIPLRIAHWLCMVAISIERGYSIPADYGSQGIFSACDYMGIPIRKLVDAA